MKHQVVIDTIIKLWRESESILLTGAANLDGDALGCLLALEAFGLSQGKTMTIVNEKPLSSLYDFLEAGERVFTQIPDQKYDAIYICDTGCFEMLGDIYTKNTELFKNTPTVNIDHHGSCYGDICWSTSGNEFASATMMIARMIQEIGGWESITPTIATALLLGVYYDTECFRNCNTTPESYEFAALMLRSGADHNLLIRSLYQSTDPRYVALYGEVLATLRPLSGGAGVFGLVTTDMLARHHIPLDCLGNELVNTYLRSVLAKYVILAKEDALQGGYRMSLRSKDEKYNMRTLAGVFDGGGHVMASGAYTKKSLEEIIILIETFDFDLPSGEIS